jgi:hypothetical protein
VCRTWTPEETSRGKDGFQKPRRLLCRHRCIARTCPEVAAVDGVQLEVEKQKRGKEDISESQSQTRRPRGAETIYATHCYACTWCMVRRRIPPYLTDIHTRLAYLYGVHGCCPFHVCNYPSMYMPDLGARDLDERTNWSLRNLAHPRLGPMYPLNLLVF